MELWRNASRRNQDAEERTSHCRPGRGLAADLALGAVTPGA